MNTPINENPLVTFFLFAYNQEKYICDAIKGAFAQTYCPLEIVLSDDCSTDRTFEIMQQMASEYQGPHKIVANKNTRNLGIGGHVARVPELASGDWVVMAAGDDVSLPNRTATLLENVIGTNMKAAFSNENHSDNFGQIVKRNVSHWNGGGNIGINHLLYGGGGIGPGATYAYHRSVFTWPQLYPKHIHNEDRVLPLRAVLLGGILHVPESLINYRLSDLGVSRNGVFLDSSSLAKEQMELFKFAASENLFPETSLGSVEQIFGLHQQLKSAANKYFSMPVPWRFLYYFRLKHLRRTLKKVIRRL